MWHKSALCAANTYGTEFQNQSADGQTTGTRVTLLDSIGSKRRRHSQAVAEQYCENTMDVGAYGLGEPSGGHRVDAGVRPARRPYIIANSPVSSVIMILPFTRCAYLMHYSPTLAGGNVPLVYRSM